MKDLTKFKYLLGSLCVSLLLAVRVPVQVYGDGAIFYPDRSYGGSASDEFGVGSYTMSQMIAKGIANDDAQSLDLTYPGYSAICYEHDNFSGNSRVWTQRIQIMSGMENAMSSVKIQRGVPSGHVYARYKSSMPEFQAGYLYGTWELFYRGNWVHLRSSEGMCGYTVRYETEYWVNSGGIAQPTVEVISGTNVLLGTSGTSDPGTCTGTAFPWEAYYWLDGEVKWVNNERTTVGGVFQGCSYNLGIRDGDASLPSPPATPSVPTGVSASTVTDGIQVSWNAASGATGYRVKRATVSGGPYTTLVADPVWMDTRVPDTSTSFTDAEVIPSTTYYYVVSAVNAGSDSADSSEVSATSGMIVILSQGKTATASSSESGNIPANGNDGSFSSRWAAVDNSYPQWWKVDLGGICDMNQVSINWYNAAERSYKYKIEVSNDDVDYTMVVDQTARTATGNSTDDFTATARYLRVTVTGVAPSGGWAGFYECRVYGTLAFALINHWPLDESEGLIAPDIASYNDGTLINGPLWEPNDGVFNGALAFDGEDDYVDIGTYTNLGGVSAFTISFWVNPAQLPFDGHEGIIGIGTGSQRAPWIWGNYNSYHLRMQFETTTGGISDGDLQIGEIAEDTWTHVAVTWDGSTCSSYINGELDNTDETTGNIMVVSDGTNYLGHIAGYGYWHGSLDDILIYNHELSSAEIGTLYLLSRPTDLDEDGDVDFMDLYTFAGQYLQPPEQIADFNNDGSVNLADYAELVIDWLKGVE